MNNQATQPSLCLSIRQPWAWLIMYAGKDIENRTWGTKYRGRIYIHAAKGCTYDEWESACIFSKGAVADEYKGKGLMIPFPEWIRRGGIVGSVEIVDCVTDSKSPWFNGPYGFVLRDPQPIPFIPCKGALGLFSVPPEAIEALGA